jgi:hypothetical protein
MSMLSLFVKDPFCLLPIDPNPSSSTNLVSSDGVGTTTVTLLSDGELDTLALGQGDPGLLGTDDEDVGLTGGKGVVNGVLQVDDVETTIVTLTVGDNTDTTHVTTAGGHGQVADLELAEVIDLASGQAEMLVSTLLELSTKNKILNLLDLDGVVDLDQRIRVADAILRVSNRGESYKRTNRG